MSIFTSERHNDKYKLIPAKAWGHWVDVPDSTMENPLDPDDYCQVLTIDGSHISLLKSKKWLWNHEPTSQQRIIKYRQLLLKWDEWIDWTSGECPIPSGTSYQIVCRDESASTEKIYGLNSYDDPSVFRWKHIGRDTDIVKYRIGHFHEDDVIETDLERFRRFFSSNPVM